MESQKTLGFKKIMRTLSFGGGCEELIIEPNESGEAENSRFVMRYKFLCMGRDPYQVELEGYIVKETDITYTLLVDTIKKFDYETKEILQEGKKAVDINKRYSTLMFQLVLLNREIRYERYTNVARTYFMSHTCNVNYHEEKGHGYNCLLFNVVDYGHESYGLEMEEHDNEEYDFNVEELLKNIFYESPAKCYYC